MPDDTDHDADDAQAGAAVLQLHGTGGSGQPPGSSTTAAGPPPVSTERIRECYDSAGFWSEVLAYHADALQKKADTWSIWAGVLAAVAGLSAWKLVTDQTQAWWAVMLTSSVALAASVFALVPRIKNYSENAAISRELAARYGQSKGILMDVLVWMQTGSSTDAEVRRSVSDFEAIKKSKDSMRYTPVRSEETRKALQRKKSGGRMGARRKSLTDSGAPQKGSTSTAAAARQGR